MFIGISCSALPVDFVVFGDGDTGFGNQMNVKRTVKQYAKAGVACIMLEDQVSPKQCGHTSGKQVVSRAESISRIKAACMARDELREDGEGDILIMARTDARGPMGMEEAITRCILFRELGADITFLEAPVSKEELQEYCQRVSGPKMCNILEGGLTPILDMHELETMGFAIAVYPFDILLAIIEAGSSALRRLKQSRDPYSEDTVKELWELTGFVKYQEELDSFKRN